MIHVSWKYSFGKFVKLSRVAQEWGEIALSISLKNINILSAFLQLICHLQKPIRGELWFDRVEMSLLCPALHSSVWDAEGNWNPEANRRLQ